MIVYFLLITAMLIIALQKMGESKMKKKILSAVLAVCLTFGSSAALPEGATAEFAAVTASAEPSTQTSGTCGDNASWVIKDGVLTISGSGAMKDYADKEDSPFESREDITKIVVESGITSIGDHAFYNCNEVTSIQLPTSLRTIGTYSLALCHKIGRMTIPEGVTSLGDHAFYWTRDLKTVDLPSTLKKIGPYCFSMCSEFESITLPDGFEELSEGALEYTSIESINFPETMTRLGDRALFASDIESVTIPGSIKRVGNAAFRDCRELQKVVVKDGVLKLNASSFCGCVKLSSVSLPDSLLFIGASCFSGCKVLENITIPPKVNTLGRAAFENCKWLKSIKVPDSVTSIGEGVFRGCEDLKSAVIPADVEEIGKELFSNCHELKSFTMPKKVKTIGSKAFEHCSSLPIKALPETVTEIGSSAFSHCDSIKSLSIPKGVKKIPWGCFIGCAILESVKLPSGRTEIGNCAFESCPELKSVNLPNGITRIGREAFAYCRALERVVIPDTVTVVDFFAYGMCENLSYVRLSKKLKTIGAEAFGNCQKLKGVIVPKSVTEIENTAFGYVIAPVVGGYIRDEDFIIKCQKNTKAEEYAKGCGLRCELISYVKAKAPTCVKAGNTAYWECQGRYFSDELLRDPLTKAKITVKATGHKMGAWKTSSFNVDKKTATQTRKCTKGDKTETKTVKNAVIRYAGSDRAQTASLISSGMYKTANTVVLATGFDFHDALAAVPLASAYSAPLLLADRDNLSAKTIAEIKRLKAKNVIVVATTTAKDQSGRDAAIKKNVYAQLKKLGVKVTKLDGKTYYETAKKVAVQLKAKTKKAPTSVFVTTDKNYADALSASPVAAILGAPIVYVKSTGALNSNTNNYLKSIKSSVKNVYIVGGTKAVSKSVEKSVLSVLGKKSATRFAGNDRYETCVLINKSFAKYLTGKSVCIAKGYNFPDALAGGVFAAKQKAPLFLADKLDAKATISKKQSAYLKSKNPGKLYIFGGETAVPTAIVKTVAKASV